MKAVSSDLTITMVEVRLRGLVDEMVRERLPMLDAVAEFRRVYMESAARQSGGNVCEAARIIGVHRNSFYNGIRSNDQVQTAVRRARRGRYE